ncbi:MAG TPA: hypothetical protein VM425_08045 [Myxococcota bacterium]|nr:hypothetical protein [Myxococcota bacterium]
MQRLFFAFVFCGFIVSLSLDTRAESPAAGQKIKAATSAYAELDFEKALSLIQQAKQEEGNSRDQLLRIYHIDGLCQGALGHYDLALSAFLKLLALNPAFRLSADVSPRVRKPFEDLLKQDLPRLEVRSIPPAGAWKGEPVGLTFEVVADPAKMMRSIRIWYKTGKQQKYKSIRAPLKDKGRHMVNLSAPSFTGTKGTLSWYALAEGEHFSELRQFGDVLHPAKLDIIDRAEQEVATSRPWYKRWWVWTIVGGLAVAGATTAAVLATRPANGGPFDFAVDFSTTP